ncbi:uncharacterized protein OCT59_025737 [Rhizophagus irregularis]|uniref:Uncharacterized protein n=3 Tax=Rhizophagus irregularis TaxID=588596 RepID=A0A2P4PPZ3_RHIID|nr:hypothetical protein GLOIN_2v1646389 [Rhizophagus irregularis DAOM 181602=DAOM 197198]POG67468.1 hypothetical protein GLOIN_2v1646389 [Rhizophagus irregularis DAOM 181602=DAOM 197198]UZO05384.1 hypothetical protein OCT59_025737 [Rhizophagus irregularis]|eukprot:XP_025174334.1 hypothetical protein GLOIN_2v1646389 [Rhizophagus irregularis DAOM 181602=DAOM 197198]
MVTVNNSPKKQRNSAQRALDRKQNILRREKNGTVSKIKKKKKKRSKLKHQKDINRLKNYNKYMQSKLMVNKLTKQYEETFINDKSAQEVNKDDENNHSAFVNLGNSCKSGKDNLLHDNNRNCFI